MTEKTICNVMLMLISVGILAISSLVSYTSMTPTQEERNWWDNHWQFRREVSIVERSGFSISDFPVEVVFEHDGLANRNGSDIRVVDDGLEIPSCVIAIDYVYATVMFEIDIAALSANSVYIYYGNPDATKPTYPKVPLTISEGNVGNATIADNVFIGWDNSTWGGGNRAVLWVDLRIDFDGNGDPADDSDLILDNGSFRGAIGRNRNGNGNIGLGDYSGYTQTPIYVDVEFTGATLRVYRRCPWVETVQADTLVMFNSSWNYANYGGGTEQNIVDGEGWPTTPIYNSSIDPGWMAFRNSAKGIIFASTGINIGYYYYLNAKEDPLYDRVMSFGVMDWNSPLLPYDQPSDCRIYWYGDNTNNYDNIQNTAGVLHNQPSSTVGPEENSPLGRTLEGPAGLAYFIYADPDRMTRAVATYDVASGSIVYGMCANVQKQGFDSNPTLVSQDTSDKGRLVLTNQTVLMFGGPSPHWCVKYLEEQRLTPVYFMSYTQADGAHIKLVENSTGTAKIDRKVSSIDFDHEDYFVIMSLIDRGNNHIFISYGFDWKGTWGAGIFLKEVYPYPLVYTNTYYIFHWTDGNADGIPQSNEIAQIAAG